MNDAYLDFLSDIFWPEWFGQGCPTNDNGDPILYSEDDKNIDEDDYYKQLFEDLNNEITDKK